MYDQWPWKCYILLINRYHYKNGLAYLIHRRHEDEGRSLIFDVKQKSRKSLSSSKMLRQLFCQFHQHFMRAFFVRKCFAQLFSSYVLVKKALSYEKRTLKMLMKLTPCWKSKVATCILRWVFHFPFRYAENACVLRTIDTYLQAVWANPRIISSKQGKNAMLWVAFWLGIFLLDDAI